MRLQSKVGTGALALLAAIAVLTAAVYLFGRAATPGPGPQVPPASPSIRPSDEAGSSIPSASLAPLDVLVEAVVRVRPTPASATTLWVPVPAADESQSVDVSKLEVRLEGADSPWELTHDEHGNRFIHLSSTSDRPFVLRYSVPVRRDSRGYRDGAALTEVISAAVGSNSATPIEYPYGGRVEEALGSLTTADRLVEQVLDGLLGSVRDISDPLHQAVTLNEVLRRNASYLKTGAYGVGSPIWFCLTGQGNCTDFHFTYLDVAARVELPGRFRIGIPLSPEPDRAVPDAGEVPGYHCWIYLDGPLGLAIDPSWEARLDAPTGTYLGRKLNDRVKLTEGSGLTLAPAIAGEPLPFVFGAYAESGGEALPRLYSTSAARTPDEPGVVTTYSFRRTR